jgi:NRPS condensation-like uncharacterized protein
MSRHPMTALYPLTVFEEYMLIDDTVDHPMTFFVRADLLGQVNVIELRAAFSEVVHRHPLLWSTVVRRFGRHAAWKMTPKRQPTLTVRRSTARGKCNLSSRLDLKNEPGIRAQLNLSENNAELWLQFHHCCSDGIGGMRFLEELFEAYRTRTDGGDPLGNGAPGTFPQRRCAYKNLSLWARARRMALDLPRIWMFVRRPCIDIEERTQQREERTGTPSFLEARLPLSRERLTRLKGSRPSAPTVNDILLRDVYAALHEWISRNPTNKIRRPIRISAPISMRNSSDESFLCHNDMSLVFVDREMGQIEDRSELLTGICQEMTRVKRCQLGFAILRVFSWIRATPAAATVVRKIRRSYATAVVSNLGRVLLTHRSGQRIVSGGLTINRLGFLVPIRNATPISLGVLTYANELTISMHYDDGVIRTASAQQLLASVVEHLCESFGLENPELERRAA